MSDMMTFPDTWEEFEKLYGFNDAEEIYTNNSRLIPSFRVKQWLDHLLSVHSELSNNSPELENKNGELISRQKAKDAIDMALDHIDHVPPWVYDKLLNALNEVPSVKPIHQTPSNTLGALDCVERQKAIDAMEKINRVFNDLGLSCAYDMPGFWCHDGKDYKVIPTKYHKGYQQALSDAEKRIKLILKELCYG